MNTLLEAAKQALDYIKDIQDHCACEGIECEKEEGLVEALRQAIENESRIVKECKETMADLEQTEKQAPVNWTTDTPVPPFKYFDFEPYTGLKESKKIKHSVEQAEQKPVAWMLPKYGDVLPASQADGTGIYNIPLYTAPQRPWVGLTDEERRHYNDRLSGSGVAEAIEAKLKEKNGG